MSTRSYRVGTVVIAVALAAPFLWTLPATTDADGYWHVGMLAALSVLVSLVWRAGVRAWGSSGALLAVAAAPFTLVLLYAAVFLDLWPTPADSLGWFVIGFPVWIVVIAAVSGLALRVLERRKAP
jgi:hypothetical protein